MPEFTVVFTVSPAVRIDGPIGYDFMEHGKRVANVSIRSSTSRDANGKEFQTGLIVRAIVDAGDIEQAITDGRVLSEGILSVMTFCSGVGIPFLKSELAYETTPDIEQRAFVQQFDVPHSPVSRGELESKVMDQLREAFEGISSEKISDRLGRAVRWYRKAALEIDAIDRFSYYWLGLEALNPILENHYKAVRPTHTCPKCGHTWEFQGLSGVRALMENEFDDGSKKFNLLRQLRVDIQHETKPIEEMYSRVANLLQLVREAHIAGLLAILGLNKLRSDMMNYEITNAVPTRIEIPAVIHGKDPSNLGPPGQDPHLDQADFSESIQIGMNGLPETTGRAKFNVRTARDVTIVAREFRIAGEGLTLKGARIE